jgi:hypothetical protein
VCVVNQIRVSGSKPQRHVEPSAVVAPGDFLAPSPPPFAQYVAHPRCNVLSGETEAVLGQNHVNRLEALKVYGDFPRFSIVCDAHAAPSSFFGLDDGGLHWK